MKPYLVAIAGGTASGKTTLTRRLLEVAGPEGAAVVELDGYYRDQSSLSPQARASINYDHPDSFEVDLLASHLALLRTGEPIRVPVYDFSTHSRMSSQHREVEPRSIIFVEGFLTLAITELRDYFDSSIFVDAPDDIRFSRRLARDVKERGRTADSVLEQWNQTVHPMHVQFCEPSKQHAHIIVDGCDLSGSIVEELWRRLSTR